MHRGLQAQAVWQAGIWDDFPPVGGCVGFKTAAPAVRGAPSPSTPPPPGRMSPQDQVEGLPSWVPHCHVDLALYPSNSMLQWRATFHLGRKFLRPKARSYFKQTHVFGQKPNSVSQTPLTVQAVPSSELGHLLRMPEGPLGQQQLPRPWRSPSPGRSAGVLVEQAECEGRNNSSCNWKKRRGLSNSGPLSVPLTSSWMSSLRSTLLSCPMRRKGEGVS